MNPQDYAQLYSTFHGSSSYRVLDNLISIPIASFIFKPLYLLRYHQFDRVVSPLTTHPLARALKIHLKTETTFSVFEHDDTWTALVGNQHVVFPLDDEASVHLFATPYFVNDCNLVDHYLKTDAATGMYPHVYAYKNLIVYLDKFDVPGPGQTYWTTQPDDQWFRICILATREDTARAVQVANEFSGRPNVHTLRFKTKRQTFEPTLVPYQPLNNVHFPDESIAYTATIDKRYSLSHPHFLIQDVLESYRHKTDAALANVGLVLQYPFNLGFEGCPQEGCGAVQKRYVALTVNGHRPDKVLYANAPYDRYMEYAHVPALSHWSQLAYPMSSTHYDKVVVDSVVIGFRFRHSFFCLAHPVLESKPVHPDLINTECLLTLPTIDVLMQDRTLTVVETFRYDNDHLLHRVKLRDVAWDVWCLTETSETTATYPKRLRLPRLVDDWLAFYIRNRLKKEWIGDVRAVKLALVLARHKICFRTHISPIAKEAHLSNDEIVLYMDGDAVRYINSVRLDEYKEPEEEEDGAGCTIC